jgi:hypothetical protein
MTGYFWVPEFFLFSFFCLLVFSQINIYTFFFNRNKNNLGAGAWAA